jgi:hypothetical protein
MAKRCRICKKFIKKHSFVCGSIRCISKIQSSNLRLTKFELKQVQNGYDPGKPDDWCGIIQSSKNQKEAKKIFAEYNQCHSHTNDKERFFNMIEEVAQYFRGKKITTPHMDNEDVVQEIYLKAIKIYRDGKWDKNLDDAKLFNYLRASFKNHLYNTERGLTVPNNPPCVRCLLRNKKRRKCMLSEGETECDDMRRYRRSLWIRCNLQAPILSLPLDEERHMNKVKAAAFIGELDNDLS